jgi:hypothetical protein
VLVTRPVGPALCCLSLALALAATGCSRFIGRGPPDPSATASTERNSAAQASAPEEGQIDVRRYLGPDYCPELRILEGAELLRRYERGHEGDPASLVWQGSFGDTARECLYDQAGNLILKVGVSGRVIAGPKGGAGEITVPFKIAVVKFKESVLSSEGYAQAVTLPATGSTTFTEVKEITVPSPGSDRDYIIYVGFDDAEWDLDRGAIVAAPVEEPPPPPVEELPELMAEEPPPRQQPPQQQQQPQQAQQPNVLPTPSGGFVLPR